MTRQQLQAITKGVLQMQKTIFLTTALNFACLVVVAIYTTIIHNIFNNEYIYQYSPVGVLLMVSIVPVGLTVWHICHNVFLTYKE